MKQRRIVLTTAVIVTALLVTGCAGGGTAEDGGGSGEVLWPAPADGNGGATDIGVTETEITTATVYSGAAAVGSNTQGVLRGVEAYYDYVNDNGGLYGRQLRTIGIDDGLDTAKAQAGCTNQVENVFAFVGNLSLVDTGCYPVVSDNEVPWVGMKLDPKWADYAGWRDFETGPPQTLAQGPYAYYAEQNPDVGSVAIFWNNVPGLDVVSEYWANTWESVGIDVVYNVGINVPVSNYTPYVVAAREAGAEAVDLSTMDITNASRVAQAMAEQGWEPELRVGFTAYNPEWQALTGEGGVGWQAALGLLPYQSEEELGATDGGTQFLKYWGARNPDETPDIFDLYGWINADLFFQGAIAAGADLTRSAMLTGIDDLESFDGSGLVGEQLQPVGGQNVLSCFIIVRTESATEVAVREYPDSGFDCENKTLVSLDGPIE